MPEPCLGVAKTLSLGSVGGIGARGSLAVV